MFGDPRVKPNPNLLAIRHAPFFALRIYPGTLGTIVGLKATADAQVVGQDGAAIAGLYACGNEMSSVFRGFYPGAGATLGPGLVRSEEHTSELQSLMRNSYAVFCLKKTNTTRHTLNHS